MEIFVGIFFRFDCREGTLKNKLSQIISGPSQRLRSFGFYLARENMELDFKTILKSDSK